MQIRPVDLETNDITPEMATVLQKGADLQLFFSQAAYRHVLDWFEVKADDALKKMRAAVDSSDDRLKANLVTQWSITEGLMKDFQVMVQEAMYERARLITDLTGEPDADTTR